MEPSVRNLANPMDGGIGDVDVAGAIDRDSFRLAQRGRESTAAVARVIASGDGLNDVGSWGGVGSGETCRA